MNMLLNQFRLLIETPNGVQKLRELILHLAISGKLIKQDSNDESASELLKRIRAEKEILIKEKKIKKGKPPPLITEEEIPYDLPKDWEWCRLVALGMTQTGTTPPKNNHDYFGNDYPFIKPADINEKSINYFNEGLSELGILKGRLIRAGSVLMVCIGGSIGKVNYIEKDCSCNQQINTITPFLNLSSKLVNYFMRSPYFQNEIISRAPQTTLPILSKGKWEVILFPLPPLNEQKRIVDKVDKLMALCDELEKHKIERDKKRVSLNNAALNKLLESRTQKEFQVYWQQIIDNFGLLYDVPENVTQLKKAILQLAIQGKLVPQDPNDEPAIELFKRIRAEKEKLIREKKIKKEKSLPHISEKEIPYELPDGWEWIRLGNLCETITKGSSPKWQGINYVNKDEGILFITSKNVGKYNILLNDETYVDRKFNEIEPRSILRKGDILMNIVGGSIGRSAIYYREAVANINQAVCLIRLINSNEMNKSYFLHFFNSALCISYMFSNQVDSARANLSMGNISKFLIPLPPLNEQKRIVEKVDFLIKLCDELESRLEESKKDSGKLMEAVLHEAFERNNR